MRRQIWPILLLVGCGGGDEPDSDPAVPSVSSGMEADSEPYARARRGFRTTLLRHGPSPQTAGFPETPAGATLVSYSSAGRELSAFVSPDPGDGDRRPAVLFLHGGFAFGGGDWEMSRPFLDAGYVVMVPMFRGENGLPGDFSLFYDEVDDALAAAEVLARLPYVDPTRIFVAGHSAGGTVAMLAAEASGRFHAAASFSGSPDQAMYIQDQPGNVPFDRSSTREIRMRSPVVYASSFRCPARLYHGVEESWAEGSTAMTASRARAAGLDVEVVPVAGDHFTSVPGGIRRAIAFFGRL